MSDTYSVTSARRIPGTRIPSFVYDTPGELARHVAHVIASLIRERNAHGQDAVLALPTGSSPTSIYRELVRLHRDEGLDFSRVVVFGLDEFYGLEPEQPQSHSARLHEHLLRHVNVRPENVHLHDGQASAEQVAENARQFETLIARVGGLDLALLGVGRNGHIGYNEPFSPRNGRTRLCTLEPATRKAAAWALRESSAAAAASFSMSFSTNAIPFSCMKALAFLHTPHQAAV